MTEKEFERLKSLPMEEGIGELLEDARKLLPGNEESLKELDSALNNLMGAFQDVFESEKVMTSLKLMSAKIRLGMILGLFIQSRGPRSKEQDTAIASMFSALSCADLKESMLMLLQTIMVSRLQN